MSLTPDQVKALRARDESYVSRQLVDAMNSIVALEQSVMLWSDSVRASAEQVHGDDAPSETLWKVPEYSASLDAVREVQAAKDRLSAAAKAIDHAEGRWPE
jgi:hypothetical protein